MAVAVIVSSACSVFGKVLAVGHGEVAVADFMVVGVEGEDGGSDFAVGVAAGFGVAGVVEEAACGDEVLAFDEVEDGDVVDFLEGAEGAGEPC